jgi:hypothetical protein
MHFPSYSGGKFIGNCLSLSKHCVPMHKNHARHLIDNPTDYDYRLKCVTDLLSIRGDWRSKREFSEYDLFDDYDNKLNWGENDIESNFVLRSDMSFIVTAHSLEEIDELLITFPHARIVSLVNVRKFWGISYKLKSTNESKEYQFYVGAECEEKYNILRGIDWPQWKEFEMVNFNIALIGDTYSQLIKSEIGEIFKWYKLKNEIFVFDMDGNIFSRVTFLKGMENLYKQLQYVDFNDIIISKYWEEYVKVHNVKNFDLRKDK